MFNMIICLLAILDQPPFSIRQTYQMLTDHEDPIQTMTNFNKSPLQYKNCSTLRKGQKYFLLLEESMVY